jgi:hypothetical protein
VTPVSELHIDFFIAAALQDREEDRWPAAFERLLGGAGDAQQHRFFPVCGPWPACRPATRFDRSRPGS